MEQKRAKIFFKILRVRKLNVSLEVLDNNNYGRFCKSNGTQRPGENVGLRVVKYPLTPIDRAIIGKDSSSTIARIFWSLTVVGRRTPWSPRPRSRSTARKNWANQGQIVKTHSGEWSNYTFGGLLRLLRGTPKVPEIRRCAPFSMYIHLIIEYLEMLDVAFKWWKTNILGST